MCARERESVCVMRMYLKLVSICSQMEISMEQKRKNTSKYSERARHGGCQSKMETQTLEIYTNTQPNEQEIFNAKIKEEEE